MNNLRDVSILEISAELAFLSLLMMKYLILLIINNVLYVEKRCKVEKCFKKVLTTFCPNCNPSLTFSPLLLTEIFVYIVINNVPFVAKRCKFNICYKIL